MSSAARTDAGGHGGPLARPQPERLGAAKVEPLREEGADPVGIDLCPCSGMGRRCFIGRRTSRGIALRTGAPKLLVVVGLLTLLVVVALLITGRTVGLT
jgi:hypothetical protein